MTITNRVSLKSVMAGNTPIDDVPDAPTVGTITNTSFDGSVTVAASAAATGGTPTTFTITPTPATSPTTFTGASPVTVSGLSDGTSYTFTAAGVNTTATGPAGAASASTAIVTAGSYFSIATVTLGSAAATISFTSIPSTYTHLQVRGIGRASNATTDENLVIQFNSDTTTNYSLHNVYGTGAATGVNASTSFTASYFARVSGASSTAGIYGVAAADIFDYASVDKYKTILSSSGHDQNGSGYVTLMSGNWRSTSAVTTLTIKNDSGSNIAAGSTFALYGVMA